MEKPLTHREYKERLQKNSFKNSIAILLDRVQSIENLALICRTAESLNISTIYLYKPAVEENSNKLKKISRSTSEKLSIKNLQLIDCRTLADHSQFIGIEVTNKSNNIYNHSFNNDDIILVGGSENNGISKEILRLCSSTFHLPIIGEQSSINLACAMSSAMHWISHNQLQEINPPD